MFRFLRPVSLDISSGKLKGKYATYQAFTKTICHILKEQYFLIWRTEVFRLGAKEKL